MSPRRSVDALAAMLADVRENLFETREGVHLTAVRAAGRRGRAGLFGLLTLRAEPLERQQNRMAGIADGLVVRSAVAGVASFVAANFAKRPAVLAVGLPAVEIMGFAMPLL
jgi:hypothetical protein